MGEYFAGYIAKQRAGIEERAEAWPPYRPRRRPGVLASAFHEGVAGGRVGGGRVV
jgi:hypothetical protein